MYYRPVHRNPDICYDVFMKLIVNPDTGTVESFHGSFLVEVGDDTTLDEVEELLAGGELPLVSLVDVASLRDAMHTMLGEDTGEALLENILRIAKGA